MCSKVQTSWKGRYMQKLWFLKRCLVVVVCAIISVILVSLFYQKEEVFNRFLLQLTWFVHHQGFPAIVCLFAWEIIMADTGGGVTSFLWNTLFNDQPNNNNGNQKGQQETKASPQKQTTTMPNTSPKGKVGQPQKKTSPKAAFPQLVINPNVQARPTVQNSVPAVRNYNDANPLNGQKATSKENGGSVVMNGGHTITGKQAGVQKKNSAVSPGAAQKVIPSGDLSTNKEFHFEKCNVRRKSSVVLVPDYSVSGESSDVGKSWMETNQRGGERIQQRGSVVAGEKQGLDKYRTQKENMSSMPNFKPGQPQTAAQRVSNNGIQKGMHTPNGMLPQNSPAKKKIVGAVPLPGLIQQDATPKTSTRPHTLVNGQPNAKSPQEKQSVFNKSQISQQHNLVFGQKSTANQSEVAKNGLNGSVTGEEKGVNGGMQTGVHKMANKSIQDKVSIFNKPQISQKPQVNAKPQMSQMPQISQQHNLVFGQKPSASSSNQDTVKQEKTAPEATVGQVVQNQISRWHNLVFGEKPSAASSSNQGMAKQGQPVQTVKEHNARQIGSNQQENIGAHKTGVVPTTSVHQQNLKQSQSAPTTPNWHPLLNGNPGDKGNSTQPSQQMFKQTRISDQHNLTFGQKSNSGQGASQGSQQVLNQSRKSDQHPSTPNRHPLQNGNPSDKDNSTQQPPQHVFKQTRISDQHNLAFGHKSDPGQGVAQGSPVAAQNIQQQSRISDQHHLMFGHKSNTGHSQVAAQDKINSHKGAQQGINSNQRLSSQTTAINHPLGVAPSTGRQQQSPPNKAVQQHPLRIGTPQQGANSIQQQTKQNVKVQKSVQFQLDTKPETVVLQHQKESQSRSIGVTHPNVRKGSTQTQGNTGLLKNSAVSEIGKSKAAPSISMSNSELNGVNGPRVSNARVSVEKSFQQPLTDVTKTDVLSVQSTAQTNGKPETNSSTSQQNSPPEQPSTSESPPTIEFGDTTFTIPGPISSLLSISMPFKLSLFQTSDPQATPMPAPRPHSADGAASVRRSASVSGIGERTKLFENNRKKSTQDDLNIDMEETRALYRLQSPRKLQRRATMSDFKVDTSERKKKDIDEILESFRNQQVS